MPAFQEHVIYQMERPNQENQRAAKLKENLVEPREIAALFTQDRGHKVIVPSYLTETSFYLQNGGVVDVRATMLRVLQVYKCLSLTRQVNTENNVHKTMSLRRLK